jgi:hypothetical protein
MTEKLRYTWQILVLTSLLMVLGILLIPRLVSDFPLSHYIATLVIMTVINLAAWFVMLRGIERSKQGGTMLLLAGIGIKFLLYLLYFMAFWLLVKFVSKAFIITFFALYLIFTFFLAGNLIKVLKNK